MPNGTIDYFCQQILKKLMVIKPELLPQKQELVEEIIDTDIANIVELAKKMSLSMSPHRRTATREPSSQDKLSENDSMSPSKQEQ